MAKQGITISMFSNIEKNVKNAEKLYQLNASRHVNRVATNFRNDIMRGMQQTPKDELILLQLDLQQQVINLLLQLCLIWTIQQD